MLPKLIKEIEEKVRLPKVREIIEIRAGKKLVKFEDGTELELTFGRDGELLDHRIVRAATDLPGNLYALVFLLSSR